jgi:hypothetical protein
MPIEGTVRDSRPGVEAKHPRRETSDSRRRSDQRRSWPVKRYLPQLLPPTFGDLSEPAHT